MQGQKKPLNDDQAEGSIQMIRVDEAKQQANNPTSQANTSPEIIDHANEQIQDKTDIQVVLKSKKFSRKKKLIILFLILVMLAIIGLGVGLYFALRPQSIKLNTHQLITYNEGSKLSYLHEFSMKDSSNVKTYQVDKPEGSEMKFTNKIQVYVIDSDHKNFTILIGIESQKQQEQQDKDKEQKEEKEEKNKDENPQQTQDQIYLFKVTFQESFTLKQIVAIKKGAKQSVIEYLLIVIDQLTPKLKADINKNSSQRSLEQSDQAPKTQENIYCRQQITSQSVINNSDEKAQLQKEFSDDKCLELQPGSLTENQGEVRQYKSKQTVIIDKVSRTLIKDVREQTFYIGQKLSKQQEKDFFESDEEDQVQSQDDQEQNNDSQSQNKDGRNLTQNDNDSATKQRKNQKMILDYSVKMKGKMQLQQNGIYQQSEVSSMLQSLSQNQTLTFKLPEDLSYIHSMDKDRNQALEDEENQNQQQNQSPNDRNLSSYNFSKHFETDIPKKGLLKLNRIKNKTLFSFKVLGSKIHGGLYLGATMFYSKDINKQGHFYLSAGGGAYIDTAAFDFNYYDAIAGGIRLKYINDKTISIEVGRVSNGKFIKPYYHGELKYKLAASILDYKNIQKKWQIKGQDMLNKAKQWGKKAGKSSWELVKNIFTKNSLQKQFEKLNCKALIQKTQVSFQKEDQKKEKKCLELLQKSSKKYEQQISKSIDKVEEVKKIGSEIQKLQEKIEKKIKDVKDKGDKYFDIKEFKQQIEKQVEKFKSLGVAEQNFKKFLQNLPKDNIFYEKKCDALITATIFKKDGKKQKECIQEFSKLGKIYSKKLKEFLSENKNLLIDVKGFLDQLKETKNIFKAFKTQVTHLKQNFDEFIQKLTNFLIQKSGELGLSMRKYLINRTKRIYHKCFMVWIIPVCFNAHSYVRAYIQGSVKPVSMKGSVKATYYVNMSASGYASVFIARGGLRVIGTVVNASLPLTLKPSGYSNYNLIKQNFKLPSSYCFNVHLHAQAFRVVLQPFYSVRRVRFRCRRWFRCSVRIYWRDKKVAEIVLFKGSSKSWKIFGTCPKI